MKIYGVTKEARKELGEQQHYSFTYKLSVLAAIIMVIVLTAIVFMVIVQGRLY